MICVYCRKEFPSDQKTDEHVIPKAILKLLGVTKFPISVRPVSRVYGALRERNMVPNTMTHKICKTCNNGWLSDIDGSALKVVEKIARGDSAVTKGPNAINVTEIHTLRLLLYKIFLNFVATGHDDLKRGKTPFMWALYEMRNVPTDVVLFKCKVSVPEPLSIAHGDFWDAYVLPQHQSFIDSGSGLLALRFKFFIQFGHAAFMLACSGSDEMDLVYDPDIFQLIAGRAKLKTAAISIPAPTPDTGESIANRLLLSIRIKSSQLP